jgi:Fe-S-cluster-containing hydrogenase component 2
MEPEKEIAMKCDLCIDTPFWKHKGGPDGEQACVSGCPAKALKLVHEPPSQKDVTDMMLTWPRRPLRQGTLEAF